MKTAIIYYSRTGNTKKVAELLQIKLIEKNNNVDLIEITAKKRPSFLKAGRAAMKQKPLDVTNQQEDLSHYQTIVIGVPIWANNPAPLYKSYLLQSNNVNPEKTAVFLTKGGKVGQSEIALSVFEKQLQKLGIKRPDAELVLQMRKGNILTDSNNVDYFIDRLFPD